MAELEVNGRGLIVAQVEILKSSKTNPRVNATTDVTISGLVG